jgi:hypothetical protein
MKNFLALLLLALLAACCNKQATYKDSMQSSDVPSISHSVAKANFDKIKSLEGNWVLIGGKRLGKPVDPVPGKPFLTYNISAGGHAVIEKLFAGTSKEMVSIYYLADSDLMMDHYCSLGNQPRMVALPSDDFKIEFKMIGITNFNDDNDLHISSHALEINGQDELTAYWGATSNQTVSPGSHYIVKRSKRLRANAPSANK